MPTRTTDGAAGYDLYSAIQVTIDPKQRTLIPLDITITPPPGTYVQLHSRSGLAAKHGLDVKAGVIDADFTGNVTVIMQNHSEEPYTVQQGDRIAQMVFTAILTPELHQHNTTATTIRADNGFGSTGVATIHSTTALQPHQMTLRESTTYLQLSTNPFDSTMKTWLSALQGAGSQNGVAF